MVVHWELVTHPDEYVSAVLSSDAPEIPSAEIPSAGWRQVRIALADIHVDRGMVARHDRSDLHRRRRDDFIAAIRGGTALRPLIVLGASNHLVDGYARYRALSALGVTEAETLLCSP